MVSSARRARLKTARKSTRTAASSTRTAKTSSVSPAKNGAAPVRPQVRRPQVRSPAMRAKRVHPAKSLSVKKRGIRRQPQIHYTYHDLPLRYRLRSPALIIGIIAAAIILLAVVALAVWYVAGQAADAHTGLPKDLSGAGKQPETQTSPREYVIEATNDAKATNDAAAEDAASEDAAADGDDLGVDSDAAVLDRSASVIDVNQAEEIVRLFARGLAAFDAAAMYPYLHARLTDKYTPEQLAQALVYFKPKDKAFARFGDITGAPDAGVATPSGYLATLTIGTDTTGWQTLELPLAIEDGGWKVMWMDNLTTNEGVIEACTSRLNDDAEYYRVIDARKLTASSCIADIAVILHDSSLCAYSFYDRGRCLRALNANLPAQELIEGCNATSPDSTTFSKCIYDAAVETDNYDVCRAMATNRAERYTCLGTVGGKHDTPAVCNEGFNYFTKQLCVDSYVAVENDVAGVCKDPDLAHFLQDCPG